MVHGRQDVVLGVVQVPPGAVCRHARLAGTLVRTHLQGGGRTVRASGCRPELQGPPTGCTGPACRLRSPPPAAGHPGGGWRSLAPTWSPMTHWPAFMVASSKFRSCFSEYLTPMSTPLCSPFVLAWRRGAPGAPGGRAGARGSAGGVTGSDCRPSRPPPTPRCLGLNTPPSLSPSITSFHPTPGPPPSRPRPPTLPGCRSPRSLHSPGGNTAENTTRDPIPRHERCPPCSHRSALLFPPPETLFQPPLDVVGLILLLQFITSHN